MNDTEKTTSIERLREAINDYETKYNPTGLSGREKRECETRVRKFVGGNSDETHGLSPIQKAREALIVAREIAIDASGHFRTEVCRRFGEEVAAQTCDVEESPGEEAASEAVECLEARLRKKLARAENHHEYRKGIAKEAIERYKLARAVVANLRQKLNACQRQSARRRSLRSTQGASSRSASQDRQGRARHRPDPAADQHETPREM